MREFRDTQAPEWSSPQPPSVVLRSGRPLLIEIGSDEIRRAYARDREHLRLIRELGVESVLAVPMIAHGRTIGVITCCRMDRSNAYGPDDVTIAQELAHARPSQSTTRGSSRSRRRRCGSARSSFRSPLTSFTHPSPRST